VSTHAIINFVNEDKTYAKIYHHFDGETYGNLLEEFFKQVTKETSETRFGEASYLAAKWIVYITQKDNSIIPSLNFLGVGIVMKDPLFCKFEYNVDCSNLRENGFPTVTIKENK